MVADHATSGAEEELERLTDAISALSAPEEEAQEAERLLRASRQSLAAACVALNDEQAREQYAGGQGEAHRLLVHSGLRDLVRDADDEKLADRIRQGLADGPAPAPGILLAAMLLFQAFETPLPADLDRVPAWLLRDYTRFLLAMPQVFNRRGAAESYAGFLNHAMALVHRYVMRQPVPQLAAEVRDTFIGDSRFLQIYFNENNLKNLYRQRAQIVENWALANGAKLAHSFPLRSEPPRRLRVGILCAHFGPQTETYFMLAHFERFPRERCSLFLYALHDQPSPLSEYARSLADATVDLPADNLEAAAARIRADDLDVLLIGTNITVAVGPLAVLASYRLARVQVVSASSPVTSGMTAADWYLNAELNESEAGATEHYTEQVHRMPGMLTRYAYHLDRDPRTVELDRADLGIPRHAVVFFSASNFFKVIPELSATWARILARVPDARLVLMPFNQNWSLSYLSRPFEARILHQVVEAGGDPDKVHIIESLPARADLHGVMSLADIYLDSYPFAGACSLLDPLLVGLPVVARTGRCFRGGVGAGLLQGLGIGDMAVADEPAYVARAAALANSADLRARERARILAALSPRNPVFDSDTGSRNMEAAFVDMASQSATSEAALLRFPEDRLRAALEQVAAELARDANDWFRVLGDVELIRLLAVPYFMSAPEGGATRRMVDVGACVGQISEPFLALGWQANLFEPDPACQESLQALANRHGGRAAVHQVVVSSTAAGSVTFYQSAVGLSGLSPSPYGATQSTLTAPATRLDDHLKEHQIERVDFLKIDAEGWDFDALRSHDFAASPPRLAMIEFGTEFPSQSMDSVLKGIAEMAGKGYDALVFSYEDDGNFMRQVWQYRLIAVRFGAPVARKDGQAGGNIIFFRRGDTLFLAVVLRLLLGFLPYADRQRHGKALQ